MSNYNRSLFYKQTCRFYVYNILINYIDFYTSFVKLLGATIDALFKRI